MTETQKRETRGDLRRVDLSDGQLRAALEVVGAAVSLLNLRPGAPLYEAERAMASVLLWAEERESREGRYFVLCYPGRYAVGDRQSDYQSGLYPTFGLAQEQADIMNRDATA